ncbi:MAG: DMT family transporter [Pseudomonadota bacterium]|nr:DMT family transporter [Pseudomonadota bacterium]MEC8549891.1 DMT family transporter [Pseudomonadota bacterium]
MNSPLHPSTISLAMLMTLSCLYALGFLSASMATLEVGPFFAGASRVIFASIFILCVALATGVGLVRGRRLWVMAGIYGVGSMAIPFIILPWTLTYVSNTTAAIYFAVIPIEVLLLSRIFLRTPVTRRKWIGFMTASAGIIILALAGSAGDSSTMAAPRLLNDAESWLPAWLPHVVCIAAAVCIAGGAVLFQAMPPASPVAITASAFLVANILALPVAVAALPASMPSLGGIAWILAGGVISTGIGMIIRGKLIRRESAVYTATNGYIVPVVTSLLGIAVLGESVGLVPVMAYLLVLGGLLMSRGGRSAA